MKRVLLIGVMLFGLSLPAVAETNEYILRVDGLACPYCAYGIEKKIKSLDGVIDNSISVDLDRGIVAFTTRIEDGPSEENLKRLINDAGFTLRNIQIKIVSGDL